MSSQDILENLKTTIAEYDTERAADLARKAVAANIDPTEAIDSLITAIREVGNGFGRGELWLP